jgi:glycerol-3-phosphate acyltransferase PlsX
MPAEGPIAVDAMGGDGAPQTIIRGALDSVADSGISVCLVGPQKRLRRELGRFRFLPSGIELVDAPEVVGMNDSAISVLRGKRQSSLNVCAELVRDGRATAMVTAGNTGAAWVAAKAALGMIDGVDRPALAAVVPKKEGHTLVLDVGANMECKPHQLVQFAVMGSFYAEAVLGVGSPKVGLMSVGEEEMKGALRRASATGSSRRPASTSSAMSRAVMCSVPMSTSSSATVSRATWSSKSRRALAKWS